MAAGAESIVLEPRLASASRWRSRGGRRDLALALVIAAWLIWLFDALNNLAPVRQGPAQLNGQRVLDLEHALRLAPEHALNVWLASSATLSQLVVFWYDNVHITVTLAVLVWLWLRRPDLLGVMGATIALVNVVALFVFWAAPTAPPRMLLGGYVDLVAAVHHLPVWTYGATAVHSNQLCSMPSLHIAWATWCSIGVWKLSERGWLRTLALLYPCITTLAVMATANHYLADAIAGAALTVVSYLALDRARRRFAPARPRQPLQRVPRASPQAAARRRLRAR